MGERSGYARLADTGRIQHDDYNANLFTDAEENLLHVDVDPRLSKKGKALCVAFGAKPCW